MGQEVKVLNRTEKYGFFHWMRFIKWRIATKYRI